MLKVRITDLLDNYYDHSVKLDPQPAPGGQSAMPHRTHRMQKPLLIAATLMLVLTGAVALGLGFQRTANSGHALAEGGETPSPVQEEFGSAVSAEPDWEEVTPEPTVGASAWEEAAATEESQAGERLSCELKGYTRQGNKLQFSLRLHDVPEGYTVELHPADVYSSIIYEATVEDITGSVLGENWEETGERLINVTVELTEEGEPLCVKADVHDDRSENYVFSESVTIPTSSFDRYTVWEENGIYEYCMEVPSDTHVAVTQFTVTQDQMRFSIQVPVDTSLSEEEQRTEADDWANTLVSITQSDLLHIYMRDGRLADVTAMEYVCELPEPDADGIATVELTINLANPIDPMEIDHVEFLSQTSTSEILNVSVEGPDTDGDGMMTAELDLYTTTEVKQSPVKLLRCFIDLKSTMFTWYYTHPQLELALAAEEDADLVLKSETKTEVDNALIEDFFQDAYLVLTDGTKLQIGFGSALEFTQDGEFLASGYIAMIAEGMELVPIDHLEINGVAYEFE